MLPPAPQPTHDTSRIDDTCIAAVRPLVTLTLRQEWSRCDAAERLVDDRRTAISRLLCLPPPCGGGLIGGQDTQ